MAPWWLEEVFIAQADMSISLIIVGNNPTTLGLHKKIILLVVDQLSGLSPTCFVAKPERKKKRKYSKD